MAGSKSYLVALALAGLGACTTMPADAPAKPAASAVPAQTAATPTNKPLIDAAIDAAGGADALGKVKELAWTGTATVNAGGKTTAITVDTLIRPFIFGRTTSWPTADGEKAARSIQAEGGNAWNVTGVAWNPMADAQAANENQQFNFYGVMMLATLKDPSFKITETAPGKDGTRNLHVEGPKAQPTDLRFNAAGKLIHAEYKVTDPAGGAAPIAQTVDFTGEVVSNGVKWPKHMTIMQNGAPFFDLDIATFDARPAVTNTPIKHTLTDRSMPQPPG